MILLLLNASILAFVQLGLVSFPEGQVFINPYRYMVFCSVISLAIAMRRHIDYLLLVRQRTILKTASETDPLTQLLNRRGMEEYLKKRDYRWNVCLALFDIDDFKSYNDTYGHAAGDACLCAAAECFREAAEGCDAVAVRYGGEEFILLFFMANREEALRFTNACLEAMRRRQLRAGYLAHHRYVTLSAGWQFPGSRCGRISSNAMRWWRRRTAISIRPRPAARTNVSADSRFCRKISKNFVKRLYNFR